ncbi:endonuclease/exonuclease/phosphatase family protein [Escherichia coli]
MNGSDYEICLFNINGLRARPHQLEAIVEKHQPDVIGLQRQKFMMICFRSKRWRSSATTCFSRQKGHYGVALLTKETPIAVRRGFPGDDEEAQRRLLWRKSPHCWVMSP